MPKDDPDINDPLELSGVALATDEDTTGPMCECLVEEYLRLGYTPEQILDLFRSPFYTATHRVLRVRGEPFVRDTMARVFARWGKPVPWTSPSRCAPAEPSPSQPTAQSPHSLAPHHEHRP